MILPFPPDPTHTPILRPISPHPSSPCISTTYPRWTPKTCRGNPLSSPLGMESHENYLQTLHLSTCYNTPYTVLYPVCSQYVIAILSPHLCSEPHLIPYCIHQPLPPSPNPTFPHSPHPVNSTWNGEGKFWTHFSKPNQSDSLFCLGIKTKILITTFKLLSWQNNLLSSQCGVFLNKISPHPIHL